LQPISLAVDAVTCTVETFGALNALATYAVGPYLMAKAAVPQLLAAGWGRIINTSKHPVLLRGIGLDPSVIVPAAVWLASDASGGMTGCRFDAKRWER
jgi:hypothetical protein